MGERSKGQKPLLGGLSGFLGHLDRTISCSIEVFGPSGASPCAAGQAWQVVKNEQRRGGRLRLEDAHAFQVCYTAAPRDTIAKREMSFALRLDVSLAPKMGGR